MLLALLYDISRVIKLVQWLLFCLYLKTRYRKATFVLTRKEFNANLEIFWVEFTASFGYAFVKEANKRLCKYNGRCVRHPLLSVAHHYGDVLVFKNETDAVQFVLEWTP